MRKLFALLLIASMPVAGFAQSLAPVISPPAGPDPLAALSPHEVPLWSTSDGRILAALALSGGSYPTLPQSPRIGAAKNEWRLVDVTNLVSGSLLLRLSDNAAAHVDLAKSRILAPISPPTLLCSGLDASASCGTSETLAHGGTLRIGASWFAGDNLDLALNYGLSWMRHDNSLPLARQWSTYEALPGLGDSALPTLIIPGAELANVQNSSISALGRLHLSDAQAFDLGAS
ncbi:MAG TPA: hypothetical protein VIE67_12090, partial [Rudaea sp.]|uniref:hypothetical protein n=1 Tax=Rudaea sp. TaxID=2136325 RepID=UPI002F950DDA